MKVCKGCRHVGPNEARFCGGCGYSFDARYCRHDHKSPANASHCIECGSDELSTPVETLQLGCVVQALVGLLILILTRVLFSNSGGTAAAGVGLLDSLSGYVLGTPMSGVLFALIRLLIVFTAPFVIVWLAFEHGKMPSRSLQIYVRLLRTLAQWAWQAMGCIWRVLAPPTKDEQVGGKR